MLLQRVVEDLKRKGNDMDRISDLSLDLQNLFNVRMKFRQKKKNISCSFQTVIIVVTFYIISDLPT